jgi:hypothetical protein
LIRSSEAAAVQPESDRLEWLRSALDGPRSWLMVGLAVTFFYVAWTLLTFAHSSPRDFIHVGRSFVEQSQASQVISGYSGPFDGTIGYDGQFMYFIALDPVHARYYVDYPPYRYTRILYPLVAGTLGNNDPNLVPYTLIAVNLGMIALGTLVLGAWLRRRGVSAWFALVYGFYPGIFITLQRDTSEAMAYSLAIVAIYLFDYGPRFRLLFSATFFALAALTRETTLVFAGIWALGILLAGDGTLKSKIATNWTTFLVFAAIATGPLLAWKAFLLISMGSLGLEGVLSPVPFGGVYYLARHEVEQEQLRTVVIPGFLLLGAVVLALLAGVRRVEIWALLANTLLYMAFLANPSFVDISSSGRVTVPIALAAALAAPYLPQRSRPLLWASAALWLAPMIYWLVLPVVFGLEHLIVHGSA